MKVVVMIRANKDTEAGVLPDERLFSEMIAFNEELVKRGIMVAGEGLQPSSKGARVRNKGGKVTVIDGPFAETKELIAGFWIWKVNSLQEAIDWAKKIPDPAGTGGEVEIRPIYEADDLGEGFTPELQKKEEKLRRELEAKNR